MGALNLITPAKRRQEVARANRQASIGRLSTSQSPDLARASELLGWQPAIQLEEGLTRTIAYFDRLLSTGVRPTDVPPVVER